VTREQIIVLAVIAAAFVAGWAVHALTGRREPQPVTDAAAVAPGDERLDRVIERTRLELDRAVRAYLATALLAEVPGQASPSELPSADPLAGEVGAALRDDAANASMLSVVRDRNGETGLSDRELDLADWGFAYGVAWARAWERDPGRGGHAIATEALMAAEPVFRAYTSDGDWPAGRNGAR
jgi:hypothetical protein